MLIQEWMHKIALLNNPPSALIRRRNNFLVKKVKLNNVFTNLIKKLLHLTPPPDYHQAQHSVATMLNCLFWKPRYHGERVYHISLSVWKIHVRFSCHVVFAILNFISGHCFSERRKRRWEEEGDQQKTTKLKVNLDIAKKTSKRKVNFLQKCNFSSTEYQTNPWIKHIITEGIRKSLS